MGILDDFAENLHARESAKLRGVGWVIDETASREQCTEVWRSPDGQCYVRQQALGIVYENLAGPVNVKRVHGKRIHTKRRRR
jgi:hypothetical protein